MTTGSRSPSLFSPLVHQPATLELVAALNTMSRTPSQPTIDLEYEGEINLCRWKPLSFWGGLLLQDKLVLIGRIIISILEMKKLKHKEKCLILSPVWALSVDSVQSRSLGSSSFYFPASLLILQYVHDTILGLCHHSEWWVPRTAFQRLRVGLSRPT